MSHAPKISVILPTYNRAGTLSRAIRSVLSQNLDDLELIVVDDASTDSTTELMRGWTDPRLAYVRHERNAGAAAARNTGVRRARGQYLAFQDSDDEWLPGKLEQQLRALETAPLEVGLALCRLVRWDGRTAFYLPGAGHPSLRTGDFRGALLRHNFALTSGWFLRKSAFDAIGPFDETLPPLEDWEWLIRYHEQFRSTLVTEPLAMIYESPDSISSDSSKYIRALGGIIGKHSAWLSAEPRLLSNLHYVLGKKQAAQGLTPAARHNFWTALRLYPGDLRTWAAWLLLVAGGPGLVRKVVQLRRHRVDTGSPRT